MLEHGIRPGHSKKKIAAGEIIHMCGDSMEIWSRLITKRKEDSWPPQKIEDLQERSIVLYRPLNPKFVPSTHRKEVDVVHDVAMIIFSSTYAPADLDKKMSEIAYG